MKINWEAIRCEAFKYVVMFAAAGPFVYWAVEREPPFIRESGVIENIGSPPNDTAGHPLQGRAAEAWAEKAPIVARPPEPGQWVRVSWIGRRKEGHECTGLVYRVIWSATSEKHVLKEVPVKYFKAGPDPTALPREFQLPYSLAPGRARYEAEAHFYCNWLQRALGWYINAPSPSVTFIVGDPHKKAAVNSLAHEPVHVPALPAALTGFQP